LLYGHVWMLPNLPKMQVSLLPMVSHPNRATQVSKFFLSQPTHITLQFSNLTKRSQHPNAWLAKCGMPKVRLRRVRHGSKQALYPPTDYICSTTKRGLDPTKINRSKPAFIIKQQSPIFNSPLKCNKPTTIS
jgi:hypothetical protein